jgi:hypothetical protein
MLLRSQRDFSSRIFGLAAREADSKRHAPSIIERKKTMPATKVKQRSVTIDKIRNKAKGLGITPGQMKRAELIHCIQMAEGCTPCFGRSNGQCAYTDCCFMPDCLKTRL